MFSGVLPERFGSKVPATVGFMHREISLYFIIDSTAPYAKRCGSRSGGSSVETAVVFRCKYKRFTAKGTEFVKTEGPA